MKNIKLLELFNKWVDLEDYEIELIQNSFTLLHLRKGEFFLEAGNINKRLGFLQKGLVRYFVYKDEEERTFEFTKEGEFIADYQSFTDKRVSIQTIQAIEDCEILVTYYDNIQEIVNTTKNGNLLGRLILEHRLEVVVNKLMEIYTQKKQDRYKIFMKHYAELSQRIPQYLIASYVGVKPESLSRIRKRFSENKS